jgi:hypothetical protein
MNIHELLEQKFRSGNGVEVSSVRISRAEWEAAQPVAVPDGFVLVPSALIDGFPEINPSNYDHDDACALNAWGVELALAAAPKPEQEPKK